MNTVVKLLFLSLSLTFPAWASASSQMQSFAIMGICAKSNDICSTSEQEFKKQKMWQCEISKKAHRCEELAKENPKWAPLMKSCEWSGICDETRNALQDGGLACLRGYKNAVVDLGIALKDMAVSLGQFVDNSWETVKRNHRERSAFLAECNKSLMCKRDLIKDDHRYNTLSDEALDKYPAVFLFTEADSMRSHMAALERSRPAPYVSVAERQAQADRREAEAENLNVEQKEKLRGLMAIASKKLEEQYDRYHCFNEVAQEELACYAIGTIVDPTLVAGYFLKGARVAQATAKGVEAASAQRVATVATTAAPARLSVQELKARYVNFTPTTTAQNEAWIAKAETSAGRSSSNIRFLDVENSQMKFLNDNLGDKNLVTSLTNYQKELLFKRIDDLERANPGLVISRYSDFKSSRFAFEGKIPANLDQQLAQVFKEVNQNYSQYVSSVTGQSKSEEWFRAGIGSTADQANVAARYSRTASTNEVQAFNNAPVRAAMDAKIVIVEAQRQELRQSLAQTSMVQGQTFHQDVFDLVRKKSDPQELQAALKQRFALQELSSTSVAKLQSYVRGVDEFSPGIHIAKRENANLSTAEFGGLTADIIGLGGANLRGTAEALAGGGRVDGVLLRTRGAEKSVTTDFIAQKQYFEDVLARSVSPGKLRTICSGDDCVSVATSALSAQEKQSIMRGLADSKYTGSFRLTFVPEGVTNVEARTILSTHGESIEKNLRSLLGTTMEPNKLKGLTFGLDMQTKEMNRGPVQLIIGQGESLRLSASEQRLIQEKFREAVRDFNAEKSTSYLLRP